MLQSIVAGSLWHECTIPKETGYLDNTLIIRLSFTGITDGKEAEIEHARRQLSWGSGLWERSILILRSKISVSAVFMPNMTRRFCCISVAENQHLFSAIWFSCLTSMAWQDDDLLWPCYVYILYWQSTLAEKTNLNACYSKITNQRTFNL